MKTQPYYSVRTSKIHGRGVFAKRPIRKGTKVIEYDGPIISTKEADEVGITTENGHSHTMLFQIDKKRVINGNLGGDARYINHSCAPNCETVQTGDKIFIEALRAIKTGEELCYDYHLQVPGKITDKERKEYACFCGSPDCRGTQIAPDLLAKQAKKDAKKKQEQAKKKQEQAKKKLTIKGTPENKEETNKDKKADKRKKTETRLKDKADKKKQKAEIKLKEKADKKKKKAAAEATKKEKKKNKAKSKSKSLSLMVDSKSGDKQKDKKQKKDKPNKKK